MRNLLNLVVIFIALNFVFSFMLSMCSDEESYSDNTYSSISGDNIDLDKILAVYKDFSKKENSNLQNFADLLIAKGLISETTNFKTRLNGQGEVVGFNDYDNNDRFTGNDKLQFKIEVDKQRERVIASDRYNNRSFFHIGAGDLITWWMISRMLDNQRSFYGDYRRYDDFYYRKNRPSARSRSFGSSKSSRSRGFSFGK